MDATGRKPFFFALSFDPYRIVIQSLLSLVSELRRGPGLADRKPVPGNSRICSER